MLFRFINIVDHLMVTKKDYVINNSASFKFDSKADHVLRLLTVKGRSVIGSYHAGVWSWM